MFETPPDTNENEDRGFMLLQVIRQEADAKGDIFRHIGPRFGMSDSAWIALINQRRSMESISRDQFKKIAEYLERPMIYVLSLAEMVLPEDFDFEPSSQRVLNETYQRIRQDQACGLFCPSPEDWDKTPRSTQLLVTLLYGRMIDRQLLGPIEVAKIVGTTNEDASPSA